jgi:hypothetical protein
MATSEKLRAVLAANRLQAAQAAEDALFDHAEAGLHLRAGAKSLALGDRLREFLDPVVEGALARALAEIEQELDSIATRLG